MEEFDPQQRCRFERRTQSNSWITALDLLHGDPADAYPFGKLSDCQATFLAGQADSSAKKLRCFSCRRGIGEGHV